MILLWKNPANQRQTRNKLIDQAGDEVDHSKSCRTVMVGHCLRDA